MIQQTKLFNEIIHNYTQTTYKTYAQTTYITYTQTTYRTYAQATYITYTQTTYKTYTYKHIHVQHIHLIFFSIYNIYMFNICKQVIEYNYIPAMIF